MKITLAPSGTASDVLPMLALAKTLQSRGHIVTICAPEEFRSRIYESEVPMFSSGKTYKKYLECEGSLEDATSELVTILSEDMAMHFVALRDGAREADALVGGRLQIAGPSRAEQLGIPYFYVVTTPGNADHDSFPIFGVSQTSAQKRRSRRIKAWNKHVLTALNRERKISHLPPVKNLFEHLYRTGTILQALDSDFAAGKILPNQITTGFWYLNENIDLDHETESYLDQGKRPVYIAPFRLKSPKQVLSLCNALVNAGHRVVLGYGWDDIEEKEMSAGSRLLPSLSYAQIFPRMSVVVHAGAEDIAMQALRAGVPQVIAPYTIEQTYWAQKCKSIGASSAPVLNGDLLQLQQGIEQVLADPSFADRLKPLVPASQNGTNVAAEAIERVVADAKTA